MDEKVTDKMLWGLGLTDNDKLAITVFNKGNKATVELNKEFSEHFANEIIRYAQLLSQ